MKWTTLALSLVVTIGIFGCSRDKASASNEPGPPDGSVTEIPRDASSSVAAGNTRDGSQHKPGAAAREAEATPSRDVAERKTPGSEPRDGQRGERSIAVFAGGCFWCIEAAFDGVPGVIEAVSGYAGGDEPDPTYRAVSSGRTGHTESVEVVFDPSVISYDELLEIFWRSMDPTDADGQFADRGSQYRPVIFYRSEAQRAQAEASKRRLEESGRFHKPIVVPIQPLDRFYPAEDYHQDYHEKNPTHYQRYKRLSGRTGFLERTWGSDH